MANRTRIEWTDATWNPVTGCSKVSQGCKHCYAERMAKRLAGRYGYPDDEPFRVTLHSDKLDEPLRWRKRRMVFVCSMSDLFHPDVPNEFIDRIFAVMAVTPQHTYQILTKRPERMMRYISDAERRVRMEAVRLWEARVVDCRRWPQDVPRCLPRPWPLPNVWVGTSVENQDAACQRIPSLLKTPAALRFLSCEPLLAPINLRQIDVPITGPGSSQPAAPPSWRRYDALTGEVTHLNHKLYGVTTREVQPVDWVIVGGETGPGARPMHPNWVRQIRNQCTETGTPFFFKQRGEWTWDFPHGLNLANRDQTFMDGVVFYRVGRNRAGALLDGREWRDFPMRKERAS